jgi:glucosamine--fructose-6-phosphate aminotransferase (isomerizing)
MTLMATEIAEQPEVLERVLRDVPPQLAPMVARLRATSPRVVLLAARGTSDNAALYAKYLVETVVGLPAGLASPSAMTIYGARPDLRNVLVVAVSQSGGSPDLLEVTQAARASGAVTLAVTNAPRSPLAAAAELHLDVEAGEERAVPATKSYTAQLLALWLLCTAWGKGDLTAAEGLPVAADAMLMRSADPADELAALLAGADRIVVSARGFAYATACEAALKLMETSYVAAHAFSGADLLHGPIAMVAPGEPALAIVPRGAGGAAMLPVLDRLRAAGATLAILGDRGRHAPSWSLSLPPVDEALSPILQILPLQLTALRLALARGTDPDLPRRLSKVTLTR